MKEVIKRYIKVRNRFSALRTAYALNLFTFRRTKATGTPRPTSGKFGIDNAFLIV